MIHANRMGLRSGLNSLQDAQANQENMPQGKRAILPAKPAGPKPRVLGEVNKNLIAPEKHPAQNVKKPIVISKPQKVEVRSKIPSTFKTSVLVHAHSAPNIQTVRLPSNSVTSVLTATSVKSTDSVSSSTQKIEDIDKDDRDDPLQVGIYVNDIFNYLRKLEEKYPIRPQHLAKQLHVTSKMRSILIDWLVEVHLQFHLLLETLYLTVAIVDMYLQEVNETAKNTLQLVGVASMFLASKYEETYFPEVSDFVYITDNAYSKEDVLNMEYKIIKVLQFNLGRPLPITFFRRYSKAAHRNATTHTMGKFLLELSIVEYELSHYSPSLVAASAMYLALWLFSTNKKAVWNKTIAHYSNYSMKEVLPVAKKLAKIVLNLSKSKYQAVPKKYASSKFYKISLRPELRTPQLKMFTEL